MITAEQILESVIEQAGQGSCKTCRWMRRYQKPDHAFIGDCDIQGNMNSIWFTEESLDRRPYPWVCIEGNMGITSDDGAIMCLAYQPRVAGKASDTRAIVAHRQFMTDLADAARLAWAIQENRLDTLMAMLNAATESLPATLAAGGNERGI